MVCGMYVERTMNCDVVVNMPSQFMINGDSLRLRIVPKLVCKFVFTRTDLKGQVSLKIPNFLGFLSSTNRVCVSASQAQGATIKSKCHRRLDLNIMYVIAGSTPCLWYIFRLLAHTLVRTRTIPNSKGRVPQPLVTYSVFSPVSKWRHFTEWSIYISHSFVKFSKNCAGFLWILRCVAHWTFLRVENPKIWTQRINTI
jgi:hypothetical protein